MQNGVNSSGILVQIFYIVLRQSF